MGGGGRFPRDVGQMTADRREEGGDVVWPSSLSENRHHVRTSIYRGGEGETHTQTDRQR